MRKERPVQLKISEFVNFFVLVCSLFIILIKGWEITLFFLSSPQNVDISYKSLREVPPLAISVCSILKIEECAQSFTLFNIFDSDYNDTPELCEWQMGKIPSYGNSSFLDTILLKNHEVFGANDILSEIKVCIYKLDIKLLKHWYA